MNTFSPKNKKKGCEWIAIFCDFCNFFADSFVYSFIFISVKQQHNHNSQYPEKCPSLYPLTGQLVSVSSVKTIWGI